MGMPPSAFCPLFALMALLVSSEWDCTARRTGEAWGHQSARPSRSDLRTLWGNEGGWSLAREPAEQALNHVYRCNMRLRRVRRTGKVARQLERNCHAVFGALRRTDVLPSRL